MYRSGGGSYLPFESGYQCSFSVSAISDFPFSEGPPKTIAVSDRSFLSGYNYISAFKSLNALPYVLASIEAKRLGVDDLILTNNDGNWIETCHSNLFYRIHDRWHSPPLSSGCIGGIMRKQVIRCFHKHGVPFYWKNINSQEALRIEEAFTCNSIRGVESISKLMFEGTEHLLQIGEIPQMLRQKLLQAY